jgi:toxin ParE1/3/4
MKLYRLREAALGDIDVALDYYQDIDSELAIGFQTELLAAIAQIQAFPGMGSPRYAQHWLENAPLLPLRFWRTKRFPYAVFYFDHNSHIEIVRVLHQASDIPQHLKNKTP